MRIHVNCDCCSYTIEVRKRRWMYGPRCRSCGRTLGPMQWSVVPSKRSDARWQAFLDGLLPSMPADATQQFGPLEKWALRRALQRVAMDGYPAVRGNPMGERAAGAAECERCGHKYADHPMDWRCIGYDGRAYLNVLCDGRRVKL